jgi:F420-non-reducing hydrogenase small subunit
MPHGQELFGSIYEKGQMVFREGEPGDTLYIIQSGAVEVSRGRGKDKVVLTLLERGDFFGEMALIDERPRSATVTAISHSRLLRLTRSSLLERIGRDPGIVLQLVTALCERIGRADQRLRSMVGTSESLRRALADGSGSLEEETSSSSNELRDEPSDKGATTPELDLAYLVNVWRATGDVLDFNLGDLIFQEGDPGDVMYLIADGWVEISQGVGEDKCTLAYLGANDFLGEMAIVTGRPRSATASAVTKVRLLPIARDDFYQVVKTHPELALYILQMLIMRLREKEAALDAPQESLDVVRRSVPPLLRKEGRIKVCFVSLSTCGGCSAVLVEDEAALAGLLEGATISYCPMLMDQGELSEAEIVVVDGAVRTWEDEDILKEARIKSRYLVAWGTCAAFGGIPALANQHELEDLIGESYGQTLDPFAYYLSGSPALEHSIYQEKGLPLLRRAGKIDNFVKVDYYLPGCPPLLALLMSLMNELKGEKQGAASRNIVRAECGRKPPKIPVEDFQLFPKPDWPANHCFASRGALCMGFVTKGGCGAVCPRNGLPCWGCRGPSGAALKRMGQGDSFEQLVLSTLARRCQLPEKKIRPVIRAARNQGASVLNFDQHFVSTHSKLR